MSGKGRSNYVVVHYNLTPKSEFTETYKTAKEAIEAAKQFSGGNGYSEITCKLTGKKGVRPWNKKKIHWTRLLAPSANPEIEQQLELPIGMMLPVASQDNEHGLRQEAGQA
jgi:hypothetical protein